MMKSFFKSSKESPYHLSVGAVLYNDAKKVACHYFEEFLATDENKVYTNFRILMRETVEEDESLERAVLRGIKEEFGSTGEIKRFIGTLMARFPRGDVWVEKTTVYFLVKVETKNFFERKPNDAESVSKIEWRSIDFLIKKMAEQSEKYNRTDLNEVEILKRAKVYIQ